MRIRLDSCGRSWGGLLLACTLPLVGSEPAAARSTRTANQTGVETAVVKVFVHANPPDMLSPWQKAGLESATGSGVVLRDRRILTNAHVVEDAVNIEVKRAGMSERYVADVAFIGHECDLALLQVADERFFEGAEILDLGNMPRIQDEVQAYGFPEGGDTISVTSGIVSRVEVGSYVHSMENLLLAQVDASLNPGNSGGPVVAEGEIVGLALQTLQDSENVGYIIPVPIIRHFLEDVADGHYDGFPALGVHVQELGSGALRTSLGLGREQSGVFVRRVDDGSPADGVVQPGDVLLELDGEAIANDGTVPRPEVGRVNFADLPQRKQMGQLLSLALLRQGRRIEGEVILRPHTKLVPGRWGDGGLPYLVFGGIVFQPLTLDYLLAFEDIPYDLGAYAVVDNVVTPEHHRVLVIQTVLPHPVNRGYQEWEDRVVASVNGVVPRDLEHLATLIDAAAGPWLEIVTDDDSRLVLDLAAARAAQPTILQNFGIPRDRLLGAGPAPVPGR